MNAKINDDILFNFFYLNKLTYLTKRKNIKIFKI